MNEAMTTDINHYTLTLEARRIAEQLYRDALSLPNASRRGAIEDAHEQAWAAADNHEWVIYRHPALLLCAHCDTSDGEEWLADNDHGGWVSLADHAKEVAHAQLYCMITDEIDKISAEL